jgi:recombination associated protein RdgC
MGIFSSAVSITRYRVEGQIEGSILEQVAEGLQKNTVSDIDNDENDKAVGWTTIDAPFSPNFDRAAFHIGVYLLFSLRIDKKSIPSKVLQKHYAIDAAKYMAENKREHLSRNEKTQIRDHVKNVLNIRIPATPNLYDLIWHHESALLWFFTTLKSANEELETLFYRSFNLRLIRLFPFTIADYNCDLTDAQRDMLMKLTPTDFSH